ncbi:anthranilate synthase component I family protein [Bacillus sp. FJAT-47783]|uniref:anthranilate synthase component I family protein n=1 Tax=Bacillus sp. FJAT-47783 TaxID=2922712 RepID=UPI002434A70D|nr:anthranilate synthase component I family protein [Bacillus sp. FJAT-47783]
MMHREQTRKPIALSFPFDKEMFFKRYEELSYDESYHVLLESGRGGHYSIAGIKPFAVISGKNGVTTIRQEEEEHHVEGNPLFVFEEWMKAYKSVTDPNLPDFQGGAIGFISYDSVRYFEKLPEIAFDDLETPDIYFLVFNEVAVYDHETSHIWLISHYQDESEKTDVYDRLDEWKELWLHGSKMNINYVSVEKNSDSEPVSFMEEPFKEAVEKVRKYIAQGDVFQVNLSVRQAQPLSCHPFVLYKTLRTINPSPYMGYIHTPQFQIVSGSPEQLIKRKGQALNTRPIAGTRSRGRTDEEDLQLAKELINNEKERAEHVMLVDLERNDLGRVCRYGTVSVNEFMVIEKYSHVMHIVSNVQGELQEGKGFLDIIRAVFPGGTITGAPKVRTMEIIEELEPTRRGIYTGSIGWLGFNDDLEFNIVIRTLFVKDGWGYVQAGAGIVIDSVPEYEFRESLKKAEALWKAKTMSEEENLLV